MKRIAPDYYNDFKCIAGDCMHSCCIGWEIDIDSDSYDRFMQLPGAFGDRVRKSISEGEDGPYFHMTKDGKCPFLNENGLCDMIIELGGESLCQICDDHPRYRNFWSDREEIGLGLCCEAAGMLILGREAPVKEIVLDDDGENDTLSDDEAEIMEYRQALIDVMQDRSMPVTERVKCIMDDLGADENIPFAHWGRFLMGLERLDEAWSGYLEKLCAEHEAESDLSGFDTAFEQLMVYLLWRHVPGNTCDCDVELCVLYAVLMWSIVRRLCEISVIECGKITLADIVEIARLYSSEIEYSDENINAILNELADNY